MDCEICHGTRWKSVAVDGAERLVGATAGAPRGRAVAGDAAIPPKFERAELSTFEHDMDTQRDACAWPSGSSTRFRSIDQGCCCTDLTVWARRTWRSGILKEVIRTKGARGYFFETTRAAAAGSRYLQPLG